MRYVGRSWKQSDGQSVVRVVGDDGREAPLNPRFDIRRHSPDGFAWGYGGSGPAQLALAILCDHVGRASPERLTSLKEKAGWDGSFEATADWVAGRFYQSFKAAVVARIPQDDGFTLTSEQVDQALDALAAREKVSG